MGVMVSSVSRASSWGSEQADATLQRSPRLTSTFVAFGVGALALEDIGTVGSVHGAAFATPQSVDVPATIRSLQSGLIENDLLVPVHVARVSTLLIAIHGGKYTQATYQPRPNKGNHTDEKGRNMA